MKLKDSQLIDLCRKGDSKAQKLLFEQYGGLVMSICLRYNLINADAEDCFQEAFIKIFSGLKKSGEIISLKKWITTVTINVNINAYHKRKKMTTLDAPIDSNMTDEAFLNMVESIAFEELNKVINKLPEGYRHVFNLFMIDGYNHNEISERLNISPSTSRSQLTRAKAILKNELGKLGIKKYERAV